MDESLAGEPYILCDTPHPKRVKRFPLDSLSIDKATGEYYYDMPVGAYASEIYGEGFRRFFACALKKLTSENNF